MERGLPLLCAALALALFLAPASAFRNDKCGDTIKIESPGYLTSPGYPHSYHPSEKCEWLIQAPDPYQRIMINFNPHFDLEDRDCKNHVLKTLRSLSFQAGPHDSWLLLKVEVATEILQMCTVLTTFYKGCEKNPQLSFKLSCPTKITK